jgi:hypothetical protein
MAMTRRERMRRCYFYEDLDRPAVYSRTGYPGDDPTYARLRQLLESRTELKANWHAAFLPGLPIESSREPYSDDFERIVEVLKTPAGDLRRTCLASLKGQPGLHETFFIESDEDAERFLSLPVPDPEGDCASFFDADAAMGDRGIVDVGLEMNPGGYTAELCGTENFAVMSMMYREHIHRLCEWRMQALLNLARFLLDAGVGPYFSMLGQEYIVPPLHGPADFNEFNVKYDKPILDLLHDGGARVHIHSHGSIKDVFQGFIDMGADVLHPFEAPPSGDITAREAKDSARGVLCLEGNLQIHEMYESTPDAVRAQTEQLIADAFDDGRGLIVCPTASPYIRGEGEDCYPQYEAMVNAVLESEG